VLSVSGTVCDDLLMNAFAGAFYTSYETRIKKQV